MSLDDFKFGKNLTTFEGLGPGKSVLRAMGMEAGGMGTIRRVERTDPDGTVHVLNTRNGFPEVVTTKPKTKTIFSRFHGLCRKLAVYVGLTETVAFQPANYLAPTTGHTRYFKAPGTASIPDRLATPADYSKTIGDYAILVNGLSYMPTDDSVALTSMQWLFQGEGDTVRVLGLVLKDFGTMFHSYYVKDYGPFRKATAANPFVALTTIGTVTVTSTEPYLDTIQVDHPNGFFTRTGREEFQPVHWLDEAAGYDPLDILQGNEKQWPSLVRTSGGFQVQASPDGRQIALMRGFQRSGADRLDWYLLNHDFKYTPMLGLSTILTVVTVDISSTMTVGPAVDVFQWAYHFPEDFSASGIVGAISEPLVTGVADWYDGGGFGTWMLWYNVYGVASTGTPYTLRECITFYYKTDGTLHVDYVEQDWGPKQTQYPAVTNYQSNTIKVTIDSGIPVTSPRPPVPVTYNEVITRSSYVINGGFGWGSFGVRTTLLTDPADRTDVDWLTYYRLTNNVVLGVSRFNERWFELNADGTDYLEYSYRLINNVSTPSGRVTLASLFPTTTVNSHFTSYNPATGVLAASNDGTGPICWV